jgi:hypothetical protein
MNSPISHITQEKHPTLTLISQPLTSSSTHSDQQNSASSLSLVNPSKDQNSPKKKGTKHQEIDKKEQSIKKWTKRNKTSRYGQKGKNIKIWTITCISQTHLLGAIYLQPLGQELQAINNNTTFRIVMQNPQFAFQLTKDNHKIIQVINKSYNTSSLFLCSY